MIDTFEVVFQLSRKSLLNYILEHVLVQSAPIVPKLQLTAAGQSGSFRFIVDSVELVLQVGTAQATLVYHVYAASWSTSGSVVYGFTDGQISIPLTLTAGAPLKAQLQAAQFQTSQTSTINDPSAFFQSVNALLTGMLDTTTVWDLFPNTPATTAQLFIGLLLNGQISCLDSETVVGVIGQGDLSKVANFLNLEDCAVALAADLVKNTILFPAEVQLLDPQDVANALNIPVAQAVNDIQNPSVSFLVAVRSLLPAPFGTGSPKQTFQGVDTYFDFIDYTFTDGAIQMTGKFHGEAPCVHITDGAFTEAVTLSISNQKVSAAFNPNPPQPTYSANFDFWCGLGALFLASNVALVTGTVVVIVIMVVMTGIKVQQQQLTQNSFSAPIFDQIIWNNLQIASEGLILRGASSASVGYDVTPSRIDIGQFSSPSYQEDAGTGTYDFPGNLVCKAQQFSYDEFRLDLVIALTTLFTDLLFPVTCKWYVNGTEAAGPTGVISFTTLAHTALPPFNEVALPNYPVSLSYQLLGFEGGFTEIDLNVPRSDYNFDLPVELVVVDASGRNYSQNLILHVVTDYVQFGQDFADFKKKCGLASKIDISKIKSIPRGVLHGGDPLTPVELGSIVNEVIAEQPASVASTVVRGLISTYGAGAVMKAFEPAQLQSRTGLPDET